MTQRIQIVIRGAVQGVGFRPFVYRLATEMQLPGWVLNSPEGVFIEAEGEKSTLDEFLLRLEKERPPRCFIQSLEFRYLDPAGFDHFEIRGSDSKGAQSTLILPDIATCPECLAEVLDPGNRRYRYPFTNCTNCGPRFTIIASLPYDRPNTSMKRFEMCPRCRQEYEDPRDRRFHAQPNACPDCGPTVELWDAAGSSICSADAALLESARMVREGNIVAIKGLGGFHLVVDAANEAAVDRLRRRKHREEKPFALMFASLPAVQRVCEVDELEARLLLSPEAPIVLLRRKSDTAIIASGVAPRNPYLGVMLPYTPLHHLLTSELGFPIVATSGNVSDEPICTDENEALHRLGDIADAFLVHDRPILRHVDDSIVRIVLGRELVLRRSRGYAPLPVRIRGTVPPTLAVGGHLKNSVALTVGNNVFISQHIGDLENKEAGDAFHGVIRSFRKLYDAQPDRIVADLHPDYLSTKYAVASGMKLVSVQHHYAHVLSCMAENEISDPVLGVSWDGSGYGTDGTIWGGEFLVATPDSFTRAATLRRFRLPGGARAIREPRRCALSLLYEIFGAAAIQRRDIATVAAFSPNESATVLQMLRQALNSPITTSAGRLFDAVASLIGLRHRIAFEGQAAMELEFAVDPSAGDSVFPFALGKSGDLLIVDWEPLIVAILDALQRGETAGAIAASFHNTLAEAIVSVAQRTGEPRVVLTGGCFQNKYLTERVVRRLQDEGFRPYWHQRVPPNDGGIALGQAVAAIAISAVEEPTVRVSSTGP